jgi:Flp pilus assembly protein TadG
MKRPYRVVREQESGQSLVETAITFVVVITIVFWVFEVCSLMYTYVVIANAANEGVRYAVVRSNVVANDANVVAHVKDFAKLSMHNVDAMTVGVTCYASDGTTALTGASTGSAPNRVKVQVTYTYVPFLGTLIGTAPTMHAYAEGRMIAGGS